MSIERGEKGHRGRRGRQGIRGAKGEAAERLKLPRRIFVAFIVLAITNAGALGYTLRTSEEVDHTQREVVETQKIQGTNQCEVLNRLAETKVFIRAFIEETQPDDPLEAKRFLIADKHLTEGIRSLVRDVQRTPNCELFPDLEQVRQEFR